MATVSVETQIASLRRIVQQEELDGIPRPKAMAKLSCLLCESAAKADIDDASARKEAYELALRSHSAAPQKSYGYTAISVCSPDFNERITALEKALQCMRIVGEQFAEYSVEKFEHLVSMSFHFMRVIIDPRDNESKQSNCSKASTRHPYRRNLNPTERIHYENLQHVLNSANLIFRYDNDLTESMDASSIKSSAILLAKLHYRLGIFFRKMTSQRSTSRWHFEQVNIFWPESSLATKAKFWCATFSSEFSDFSETFIVDRCPSEYIVNLYSTFATNFDDLLVNKLGYETPTKLRQITDKFVSRHSMYPTGVWASHCADLGCGTGLSGAAFRNCVQKMTGVDLSNEMIQKARLRCCYDELITGNIEDLLFHKCHTHCNGCTFDLVIACDVFVYIGDLQSIFTLVQKRLTPAYGVFAFSTEMLDEKTAGDRPFLLQSCARFAHKRSYIEFLCEDSGLLLIDIQSSIIRRNQGADVVGYLVIVSKP